MEFGKLIGKITELTGSKKKGDPEAIKRYNDAIRDRLRAPGRATDPTAHLSADQLDQYEYQERARKKAESRAAGIKSADLQPPTYNPKPGF